jgi:hypothetical protein
MISPSEAHEPFSRQELNATLADLKTMWGALADLAMSVPGAKEVIGPRKDLPETIDMIFAQAATNGVPHEELMLTVWKDGSYLCQSVEDDRAIQMTTDWFVSIPLVAGYHALQSATQRSAVRHGLTQVDRVDAVNLARNVKENASYPLTPRGQQVLADAVLALDAELLSETPAGGTAKVPDGWTDQVELIYHICNVALRTKSRDILDWIQDMERIREKATALLATAPSPDGNEESK